MGSRLLAVEHKLAVDSHEFQNYRQQISHFGMCELARTKDRVEAVDFSEFTFLDEVTFISQAPRLKKGDFLFYNQVTGAVWICNIVMFFVVAIAIHLAQFKTFNQGGGYDAFRSVVVKVFAIYLKQCM